MTRAIVNSGRPGSDVFPESQRLSSIPVAVDAFDHVTTIQRQQAAAPNPWGSTGSGEWQDHVVDTICLFFTRGIGSSGDVIVEGNKIATEDKTKCLVPLGTSVKAGDRIMDVHEGAAEGPVIAAGPHRITDVSRLATFLELSLETFS